MRSLTPCFRLAAVAAACAACATAGASNAPPIGADGVGLCPGSVLDSLQVADVAITDTTARGQWVVESLNVGRAPRYPHSATDPYVEADVVASFIVDTTGRVAPRSVAIDQARAWRVGPRSVAAAAPSAQEFSIAVCEYLPHQRYAPIRAKSGGPPVRARLTVPMTFRFVGPV